ncbi:MAG: hypothetical protein HZB14_03255 [Actinobacteria bacterium]|nr:hypothetical protein [Actinomycetota bacterium]
MSGAPVRARFAPSPTGPLHVGSARTALLNWMFVRSPAAGAEAELLLRIDDTDRERSHADFEVAIVDDLRWLGIDWDRGPVHQSDRAERHAEALAELPTIDRDGAREFEGRVIARADGSALYNLAAAVDDLQDGITHVLRGRDHLSNTELQSAIIRALGAEPPVYVHAPLLTLPGGAKISKREGHETGGPGLTIAGLREAGYPASAILNALALSLADFGVDEVMLDPAAMAARFDLARLHSADSRFDFEKLDWIGGQHIRALDDELLARELRSRLRFDPPTVAIVAARTAGGTFEACARVVRELLDPPEADAAAAKLAASPEAEAASGALLELLGGAEPAPPADLPAADIVFGDLKAILRERGIPLGPALHGLRARLTGRADGPEFPYVLATLSSARLMKLRDRA